MGAMSQAQAKITFTNNIKVIAMLSEEATLLILHPTPFSVEVNS